MALVIENAESSVRSFHPSYSRDITGNRPTGTEINFFKGNKSYSKKASVIGLSLMQKYKTSNHVSVMDRNMIVKLANSRSMIVIYVRNGAIWPRYVFSLKVGLSIKIGLTSVMKTVTAEEKVFL